MKLIKFENIGTIGDITSKEEQIDFLDNELYSNDNGALNESEKKFWPTYSEFIIEKIYELKKEINTHKLMFKN